MLNNTDFEKKISCDMLALVVVEENDANNEPIPMMQLVLEEFADVVQDDIPLGLPLLWDI